jgi:hypothetical protein
MSVEITPAMLLASPDPAARRRGRRVIRDRVRTMGWSHERAMTAPLRDYTPPDRAVAARMGRKRGQPLGDRGGLGLDVIGEQMGISKERVRQIEEAALAKLRRGLERLGVTADEVAEWLTSRTTYDPGAYAETEHAHACTVDAVSARSRRQDERIAAQAPAWQTIRADRAILALEEAAETARAHRMIERVVCGMEGAC